MSSQEAEQILEVFKTWSLHRPDHASLARAIQIHRRYRTSWWDALILNSAIDLGCETLWTEDFHHGQRAGGVTIRNPFR